MKGFELIRHHDVTGVSGLGRVAVGVVFDDGIAVTHWLTDTRSTVVWHTESFEDAQAALERIHGHGGHTEINWLD